MKLFISYSSKDRALVEALADDLDLLDHEVWFDRELNRSGGHQWWKLICEQIRACEGFIYALSPHVLTSVPCQREYQYARDLGKPVLPLVVADLDYRYLPIDLQAAQILKFRERTTAEKKAIRESLRSLPPCPPLPPNALELEPPAPLDPVGVLIDRIRNLTANPDQQKLLILDIDDLDGDPTYGSHVPELLRLLTARDDVLTVRNLRRAQELLDKAAPPKPPFTLPLLEWIDIPAGQVTLEDDAGTFPVEPFKIAKYSVTNAQFQAFIDDGGYREDRYWKGLAQRETAPKDPSWSDPTHPRETVNWYEAMAFTRWLSEKTGLSVTLPTEWQWQWAAVGDTGWAYPYGNSFDPNKGNTSESKIWRTTPVDRYPQGVSPFGVVDMAGNVWEWCLNEFETPRNVNVRSESRR
ncbi:MAG: SUMF1/EgtB/PvdO family nonheme iron enzyme, partial [Anaerolineae bacterium]|nr:SUMF1/EgtB/PvdO family nonheme iron enzyme [Anaerolineae bacterium]